MSGLDIVMLADANFSFSTREIVLVLLFAALLYGLPVAGLILSFFRRGRWLALAASTMACGVPPAFILLSGGTVTNVLEWFDRLFLNWDTGALARKIPFVFVVITVVRVFYLHWKEKNQPKKP